MFINRQQHQPSNQLIYSTEKRLSTMMFSEDDIAKIQNLDPNKAQSHDQVGQYSHVEKLW